LLPRRSKKQKLRAQGNLRSFFAPRSGNPEKFDLHGIVWNASREPVLVRIEPENPLIEDRVMSQRPISGFLKFLSCGFLVVGLAIASPLSAGFQDNQDENEAGQNDADSKKGKGGKQKNPKQLPPPAKLDNSDDLKQVDPDSAPGKKKPSQPKRDNSQKGRGEHGGEIPGTDENPDRGDDPLDGPIRIERDTDKTPPAVGNPGELPPIHVDLSLHKLKIEPVSGDRHRLSATIRNDGSRDWSSGGKVVFAREGFGVEIPRNPGPINRDPEGPKRGHRRLDEVAIPEIAAGGKATVSIEVDNLASYYAHLELPEKSGNQGIRNSSQETRVEHNWLENYAGGFAMDLDVVLDVKEIKDAVASAEIRLHNGKGTMEIPDFIERQEFDIPDGPIEFGFLGTDQQIDYFVNDINARSTSIRFEDGQFKFDIQFETQGEEVKVGGNQVSDFMYPDVQTNEFRIKVDMPMSFNRKAQLFELEDAEVSVTADWEFDTVPGIRDILNRFLRDVNDEIESELRRTFNNDIAEMIEWELNYELRDNLLPIKDRYGNIGEITRLEFEDETEIRVFFSQPK
jgi:hypothetical protein